MGTKYSAKYSGICALVLDYKILILANASTTAGIVLPYAAERQVLVLSTMKANVVMSKFARLPLEWLRP
jgi:hypothetical protein